MEGVPAEGLEGKADGGGWGLAVRREALDDSDRALRVEQDLEVDLSGGASGIGRKVEGAEGGEAQLPRSPSPEARA